MARPRRKAPPQRQAPQRQAQRLAPGLVPRSLEQPPPPVVVVKRPPWRLVPPREQLLGRFKYGYCIGMFKCGRGEPC